jgi:HAD superfamily hydrolase (TIGR01459 family)
LPIVTRYLQGLRELAPACDALLLDQWGVLHDGHQAYPGAVDCLRRLRDAGKAVVILSNSGKSGEENARLIEAMGFGRELFDAVVSAGDDVRDAILSGDDGFHAGLGRRCLLLSREADRHVADGLGLEIITDLVDGPDRADFVLLMSMDAPAQSVSGWEPVLRRTAARRLPMVCGNPDLARVTRDGTLLEAPGLVARRYEEIGGEVRLHGKPDSRIYRTCLRRLPARAGRVVAIGDSLHHDILGANRAGLRSLLVAGGVHREELGCRFGELPDPALARALFERTGAVPDLVAPVFGW